MKPNPKPKSKAKPKSTRAAGRASQPELEGTDGVDAILAGIVRDFGHIWTEPGRLRAVLNDLVSDRRSASLLLAAAEEGIVHDVHACRGATDNLLVNRLTQILVQRRALDPEWANWAVLLWAKAISEPKVRKVAERRAQQGQVKRRPPPSHPVVLHDANSPAILRPPGTAIILARKADAIYIVPPNYAESTRVRVARPPGVAAISPRGTPNAGTVFIGSAVDCSISTLSRGSLEPFQNAESAKFLNFSTELIPRKIIVSPAGTRNAGYVYIATHTSLIVLNPDGSEYGSFAHGSVIDDLVIVPSGVADAGTVYLLRGGEVERWVPEIVPKSITHVRWPTVQFEAPAVAISLGPTGTPLAGYLVASHESPGGLSLVPPASSSAVFVPVKGWLAHRLVVKRAVAETDDAAVIGSGSSALRAVGSAELAAMTALPPDRRRTVGLSAVSKSNLFTFGTHLEILDLALTSGSVGALAWGTARSKAATQLVIATNLLGERAFREPDPIELESYAGIVPAIPVIAAWEHDFLVTLPHSKQLAAIDHRTREIRTVTLGEAPTAMALAR